MPLLGVIRRLFQIFSQSTLHLQDQWCWMSQSKNLDFQACFLMKGFFFFIFNSVQGKLQGAKALFRLFHYFLFSKIVQISLLHPVSFLNFLPKIKFSLPFMTTQNCSSGSHARSQEKYQLFPFHMHSNIRLFFFSTAKWHSDLDTFLDLDVRTL